MALVGVVLALLTVKNDVNPLVAVAVSICAGLVMGAWQGWWVTRVGVSSFIVTLAGMLYFRGISMIATNGATVAPLPKSLTGFATGFLPTGASIAVVVAALALYAAFRLVELRRAHALDVLDRLGPGADPRARWRPRSPRSSRSGSCRGRASPTSCCSSRSATIGAEFLMRRTRFGARLYAIGGNPEAARLSGIDLQRDDLLEFRHRRAFATASPASR